MKHPWILTVLGLSPGCIVRPPGALSQAVTYQFLLCQGGRSYLPRRVVLSSNEISFVGYLAWDLVGSSRHFIKRVPLRLLLMSILECGCFRMISDVPTEGQGTPVGTMVFFAVPALPGTLPLSCSKHLLST